MWRLDGTTLKNKEGRWTSASKWKIKKYYNYGSVHIINTSLNNKVLGATEDGEVKLLHKAKNIHDWPVWAKGQKDNEGYFTLTYHKDFVIFNEPLLTANYSMNRLTIKGKKL